MENRKRAKYVYVGIVIGFFIVFFITAEVQMNIPYSSRAFLEYQVVPVYSKVSESLATIYVKNGEHVELNQPLFSVDKDIYEAQYKSALGQYREVMDSVTNLKNDIEKTKALVEKNRILVDQNRKEFEKFQKLYNKSYITELDYKNMNTKLIESEKVLKESQGNLNNLLAKYKNNESNMGNVLIAKGTLEKAEINLKNTITKAPISGEVVMDNLHENTMVKENTTLFYIKNDSHMVVNVDIKEKNISSMIPGRDALILFDGISGTIYRGKIEKVNPILAQGYTTSSTLINISDDNRWVRDPGKVRISIEMEDTQAIKKLASGSKASVILLSKDHNEIFDLLAKIWINIIKVFNYVY